MTHFRVILLATLVGAGITGAAGVLHDQGAGDAALETVGAQTTISSEAAVAWQGLRRPRQRDPAPQEQPQEQAVVQVDSFRTSTSGPTPAAPLDTIALARALQRELKRAGCYHGEISGIWTMSTRQAMKAYTDIVNARLPVTNPDPVLLALMHGDQHLSCGVAASSPPNAKSVAASEVPTAAFLEPPMALAGPKTSEADGKISAPQEAVQKAKKRHNINRAARTEHWSAKLWRDSTN